MDLVKEPNEPDEERAMWNIDQSSEQHLSHDLPCPGCGHAVHTYLPCSDTCACRVTGLPGAAPIAA